MKVEFTENGIHATMDSPYKETQINNTVPVKWTKSLIWGAISLILSCFSIGLGLIGGLGTTWIKSWATETNAGIAFLLATIISFILVGISILASIQSIRSFLQRKTSESDENDKTKMQTNEIAGVGCSVIAILICIICIIVNIYWLLL